MKIDAGSEKMSVTRNRTKISSATLTNGSGLEFLNIRERNMSARIIWSYACDEKSDQEAEDISSRDII
jgi:hypothetical protein